MKLNFKVRLKNKAFWITFIPAVLLLVSMILDIFGVHFDFSIIQGKVLDIVEGVFLLLTILGVVNDPTTAGLLKDSNNAMTYEAPKKGEE